MSDKFFNQDHCDRCRATPLPVRIMSWFNSETICMDCSDKESELKKKMREAGLDPANYEGCGYVPQYDPTFGFRKTT